MEVISVSRLPDEQAGHKGSALAISSSPFEIPSGTHKEKYDEARGPLETEKRELHQVG